MSGMNIVTQLNPHSNGNAQAFTEAFIPQNDNNKIANWLQDKVKFYEAEVSRLEQELKQSQILLRGHITWLADIQRKAGQ